MGVLWDLAERTGVTCFGTSASYVAACMNAGLEPSAGRDLSRLRAIGSTGSPLLAGGVRLGLRARRQRHLAVLDLAAAPTSAPPSSAACRCCPVYRGRAPGPLAWAPPSTPSTSRASSVIDQVGELVITEPMPSMPLFLWDDADGSRYRESYFEQYPGVWRHGDWIEITSRGTAVIYGRSDSTINRQGVRMGTSEIYRAVQGLPEVLDALVVDVPRPGTEGWMPLFVVLATGTSLDADLERGDQAPDPRAVLAPPRPERRLPDRRGAPDAERQGARGAGEADPHRHSRRSRRRAATRSPTRRRSTTSSSSPEARRAGLRARNRRPAPRPRRRPRARPAATGRPPPRRGRTGSRPSPAAPPGRASTRAAAGTGRAAVIAAYASATARILPSSGIW